MACLPVTDPATHITVSDVTMPSCANKRPSFGTHPLRWSFTTWMTKNPKSIKRSNNPQPKPQIHEDHQIDINYTMLKASNFRIILIQTLILNKPIHTKSIQHHTLPRLFIPQTTLNTGIQVPLSPEQTHYLTTVLRIGNKKKQSQIRIFNPLNGEWLGKIHHPSKKER